MSFRWAVEPEDLFVEPYPQVLAETGLVLAAACRPVMKIPHAPLPGPFAPQAPLKGNKT